jgi:hypothetical protein
MAGRNWSREGGCRVNAEGEGIEWPRWECQREDEQEEEFQEAENRQAGASVARSPCPASEELLALHALHSHSAVPKMPASPTPGRPPSPMMLIVNDARGPPACFPPHQSRSTLFTPDIHTYLHMPLAGRPGLAVSTNSANSSSRLVATGAPTTLTTMRHREAPLIPLLSL